ncbi:MAG: KH domain-containing protein [Candidatus Burarchaeum sp.]|nr:KH domain-containing protein [Candidatus Burarchaeum sp.]MDO8339125.1 KH domain-containing protein [Candidatus Burarchaeum sp.]
MKLPICELCASSGTLCSGCSAKLADGRLTELDVKISALLYKMKDKYNLNDADFTKAIDLGRVVLVLTKGDVGKLIGREGKVVAEISQEVGKKVRIAEMSGDVRKTISDIIMPAKLLGINEVFSMAGTSYKVRLPSSELSHLPIDLNSLEKALYSLLDSKVSIVFE